MKHPIYKFFASGLVCFLVWKVSAVSFYVATNGADGNPGTLTQPLQTIQNAANRAQPGDTIFIRGGTYHETVVPARSGSSSEPITYAPYENESVVISGADVVAAENWTQVSNSIFQASAVCVLDGGNQVFVDGQMMNEARFPNTTLDISHPIKLLAEGAGSVGSRAKAVGMITNSALIQPPGYWIGATLNIVLGKVWCAETVRVTDSGPGWLKFNFKKGEDYQPVVGNPFFLTGKAYQLDAPGEWFYDPARRTIRLQTPAGDSPALHRVETKARQYAFDLRGKSHIVVRGLEIFAATVVMDEHSRHDVLDGLTARYVSHYSELERWRTGLADSGIILNGESNVLQNCVIAFSAGNGVALSGTGNIVSNNVIHDVDYSGGVGAGINTGGGCSGAVIVRNSIYDVGHRMIDMGHLKRGLIAYNDLSHGGLQVTDFGGIYAAATDGENTRICYNQIHDTDAPSSGLARPNNSKGIYLDNGSSNYVVDHNVTWNVEKALVLNSREGTAEINRNNLILNNTLAGVSWSYGWKNCPSPGTLIANNIFLAKAEPGVGATISHNLFPNTDPRFVPGSRFELAANSPARKSGLTRAPYVVAKNGMAPDLGALAYGVPAWTAGASLPTKPNLLSAKINTTSAQAAVASSKQ
jgi:Right handed beta helix region